MTCTESGSGEGATPDAEIIFLDGASSSGKTVLGRAIQKALDRPFFYFSSDQLVEADVLPAVDREVSAGDWAWMTVRPRFFDGFHRCIAALAAAGNDLIVEHVVEYRSWLEDCVRFLAPFDVFLVAVTCPLPELERRERERGDRTIGEGRGHLLDDGVLTFGPYDFEIDTSRGSPEQNARRVLEAFAARTRPSAFRRMLSSLKADS